MHEDPKVSEPSPPGSHAELVDHPSGAPDRQIELSIFKDHRYSFFYWLRWNRQLYANGIDMPPTLVTIDWHRDLAPPSDEDKEALDGLNLDDLWDVRDFTINRLDPHNDGHLLAAVWLNLFGDVILLKNYGVDQRGSRTDPEGQKHKILEFSEFDHFEEEICSRKDEQFYLDIDIDYFIHNKVVPYQRADVQLYGDEEIRQVIDPQNRIFRHLLPRLAGFTLATEPRYCGGIRNSNHILEVILDQLFTREMEWKHLGTDR